MAYPEKRGKGASAYYRARYRRRPGQSDGIVKDADGRTVRFTKKLDAQKAGNDAEADFRAGRLVDTKQTSKTVGEWYAEWRPAQHYARINTEQAYDRAWRKHIRPRWENEPVAEILPIQVQAWEAKLRKTLAPSSVTVIMSPFRHMLEDAAVNLRLLYSPLPPKRRPTSREPRVSKGVAVPLGTWEAICARLDAPDALLARIVFWTGMRWSEVSAMRTRFLTIVPAEGERPAAATYYLHPDIGAVHEDEHGHRHYGAPKSGPGREWELPAFLAAQVINHVARLRAPGAEVHADDRDLLFPDHLGRPHNEANWKLRWRRAADGREAARPTRQSAEWEPIWPGLRVHDGKHSHGAMLDDLGVHRVMRDYRLGHSDGSARSTYEHPTPDMRRQVLIGLQARWESWQAEKKPLHPRAPPRDLFEHTRLAVTGS